MKTAFTYLTGQGVDVLPGVGAITLSYPVVLHVEVVLVVAELGIGRQGGVTPAAGAGVPDAHKSHQEYARRSSGNEGDPDGP